MLRVFERFCVSSYRLLVDTCVYTGHLYLPTNLCVCVCVCVCVCAGGVCVCAGDMCVCAGVRV